MSALYIDSQAPYRDSEAVPDTTKSFASSLKERMVISHENKKKIIKYNNEHQYILIIHVICHFMEHGKQGIVDKHTWHQDNPWCR